MLRRTLTAAFAVVLFWAPGALAGPFTKTDGTFTADDGVQLAYSLYEPTTPRPAAGYPAIVMFHGLGGTRISMNTLAEQSFANEGYAVLTFDFRGHGQSGGLFSADGPRELSDFRELFGFLASKPEIDGKHIGAWGISLGGGAVWASVVNGIPFAAGEVVETWTDLYSALLPQDLSKSGLLLGFLSSVPGDRTAPEVTALKGPALSSTNLSAVRAFAASRSSRPRLSSVTTPMFMFQGRRDYAFDIDQAWQAFVRLKGPKRLYIGDFGHPPSTFPGPDIAVVIAEGSDWFDRFLKGTQNGIDKRPPVELAAQPYAEAGAHSYPSLPPTKALRWTLGGSNTLVGNAGVSRPVHLPRTLVETFGAPTLEVTVSGSFPHLLAVLTARLPDGTQEVVSEGGIALKPSAKPHTVTIRLLDFATTLPAGTKLSLSFAGVTTGSNVVYLLSSVPDTARLAVGKAVLTLPVLATSISRTLAAVHSTPGVTDTAVKIGGTVPLSGPAAAFGVVGPGAAAYFAWVNDHGGVNGRTIQYQYVDDGYDPTQTVQLTRQLVQQDQVLAIFNTIGTDNALAVQPLVNQLKVPELFAGTGASRAADPKRYPWTMPYLPSFAAEGAIYGRYVLRSMPKARIGVLQEDDDYGKNLLAGLSKALGAKGAIVDIERYELTDTDVSAQVAKLKSAGANALMVFATPKFAIQAFIAASKLGWHPQFFVSSVSIEPTVMKIVSASTSPAFAEGALSIAFVKDPTNPRWARDPAVKLYRQIMAKYDPQGRPTDVYNFYGMTVAYTMVDVLKHAGRNLTRESLMRAAAHLAESDNPFLLPGIVLRTSPTDYYPIDQAALFRYHKGLWTQFGSLVRAVP